MRKAYLGKVEQVTSDQAAVVAATLCRPPPATGAGGAPDPAAPANLPTALTSFVGREHELAEVRRLLARRGC